MEKKRLPKKLIIILIIIVAVVVVAIFAGKKLMGGGSSNGDNGAYNIQLQTIQKQDLSDTISLSGTVTGENQINYTSEVVSTFKEVKVTVGDEIKAGDIIAVLDQESLKKDIAALEKAISNSNALSQMQSDSNKKALTDAIEDQKDQLADAQEVIDGVKNGLTAAKKDMEQAKKVYDTLAADPTADPDAVADAEAEYLTAKDIYDQKNASYNADLKAAQKAYDSTKKMTDDAIASAKATIEMEQYSNDSTEDQQTQLAEMRKQLNECTIVCEQDGVVTAVNAYEGGQNSPGSPICTVENNKSMVLTASVEETEILKLQEGQEAIVTAKALGDVELKGEVIKVIKIANGGGGMGDMGGESSPAAVNGFSVQIRIEPSELISGMSAKAKIFISKKTGILAVPYDIVMYDEAGEAYVLAAVDNGDGTYTAEKRMVTLGEEVNYFVEVTGGGIAEGDVVIMDTFIMEGEIFKGMLSMEDVGMMMDGASDGMSADTMVAY